MIAITVITIKQQLYSDMFLVAHYLDECYPYQPECGVTVLPLIFGETLRRNVHYALHEDQFNSAITLLS